jgi:PAS domain S-box-containing protein
MALWAWTLALPMVLGPQGMASLPGWITATDSWLNPKGLFGLPSADPYTQGVLWSLGLNALTLVLVSRAAAHRLTDRTQASRFVTPGRPPRPEAALFAAQTPLATPRLWGRGVSHVTQGELRALAARFVGEAQAETTFHDHGLARGRPFDPDSPADAAGARMTERLLSGAIGAASARLIVANALADTSFTLEDVASLLDDTSQELQFSRELLQAALENIQQGVSVVDRDLRIVAWNTPYLRLFNYPEDLVRVGRPIADVIRLNAERGWCGPGEVELHVQRRLEHLTAGQPHNFERRRPDGVVIQSHGQPIPGGGYVMSFSDITRERQREEALADLASRLEARVAERTAELETAHVATETAREAAEQANASKTRFLAAASHDLLQPLNAARLFLSAAREDMADPAGLLGHVDRAIQSADRLIRTLLDISKLDHGKITPEVTVVPLEPLFAELCEELRPRAEAKGLRLRYAPTRMTVRTDRVLLRSVLQNFLSNAVRYTRSGGVLIGARPLGREVRIGVCDTGPGVPAADRAAIFEEFRRLPATAADGDGGVGLGLAIVTRIARLIGGHVELESVEGQGSQFSIRLLRGEPGRALHLRALRRPKGGEHGVVQGLKVLCIDDQPGARDGLAALLSRWGCRVATAQDLPEALRAWDRLGTPDAVVADYHLAGGATGLQAIAALRARGSFLAVLLTADAQRQTRDAAIEMGVAVTLKPLDPAVLKALLARARVAQGV